MAGRDESDRGDLRRLQEWLTLALQSAQIGAWEWEIPTGLFQVSNHWCEMLGFVDRRAAPRTIDGWLGLVHIEDRPICDRFVASLLDSPGTTLQAEFRLQRADGALAWQLCRGRLMVEPDGAARFAVGVLVEITAQREARARQHQNERLEALGQLTGGLAHDFNNLLTVIQGNVDLLLDDLAEHPAQAAILGEIAAVVDRGAAVTRRLLRFARSDLPAKAVADPDRLLRGVMPLLAHTLGGAVALHMGLAARGWAVTVDCREFENAILNLAINARDAMPSGGTLTVSTRTAWLGVADVLVEHDEKPGAYVMVSVSDTGHGMSGDVLARIREPFFTTKADKGTGLGVPMVERFVRQTDGCLRIESEVGAGTTVRLYLPRAMAAS